MSSTTFLLGPRRASKAFDSLRPKRLSTTADIRKAIPQAKQGDLWIALAATFVEDILRSIKWPGVRRSLGDIIVLDRIRCSTEAPLSHIFQHVVSSCDQVFLPWEELAEVLSAPNREDYFIAGTMDQESETLTLWRGDFSLLVVPFSAFPTTTDGVTPDFDRFSLCDCGQFHERFRTQPSMMSPTRYQ